MVVDVLGMLKFTGKVTFIERQIEFPNNEIAMKGPVRASLPTIVYRMAGNLIKCFCKMKLRIIHTHTERHIRLHTVHYQTY